MSKPWVRWGEWLGEPDCPYARRWVLDLRLFTLRVHHFIASDDPRYMHDHPWWFLTFVLAGGYTDHNEDGDDHLGRFAIRWRSSAHRHWVEPDPGGVWTFVISGRHVRTWGFWVKGKFLRARRFFFDYGHPACDDGSIR